MMGGEKNEGGESPNRKLDNSPSLSEKVGQRGDQERVTTTTLTTSSVKVKRSIPVRIVDSFRRDPNQHVNERGEIVGLNGGGEETDGSSSSYDLESAMANAAKAPLARKLKSRHLQMIAIGGAIGMLLLLFLLHVYSVLLFGFGN